MNIIKEIEVLEKTIKDKNNSSDFAPIVQDTRYDLQQKAMLICNELSKAKFPRKESYKNRMVQVLAAISTVKEK